MPSLSTGWGQSCSALCHRLSLSNRQWHFPVTSWVRGLWQKEGVSHSCWPGCAWVCQGWTEVTGAHYQHYSGNASSWLQHIKFSQCPIFTICKCLLNDIWCLLTENIVKISCWLPAMPTTGIRSFGSTNWENSQTNLIPGLQKWQVLDIDVMMLSETVSTVPNAVNVFIMCVFIWPHVFANPHVRSWATYICFTCQSLVLHQFQAHTRRSPGLIKTVCSA